MAIKTTVTYSQLKTASVSFQDVQFGEIKLDPDTLNRYFRSDLVSFSEVFSWVATKPLDDSCSVVDSTSFTVTKPIAENATASDIFLKTLGKNETDGISTSDATTLAMSKPFTEQANASDSGLIVCQDYCNIGYFLTDFVGQSATI